MRISILILFTVLLSACSNNKTVPCCSVEPTVGAVMCSEPHYQAFFSKKNTKHKKLKTINVKGVQ